MTKLLKDKLSDNHKNISNFISNNPDLIEIKKNGFPNGDYAINVSIEKRNDDRNPESMVLRSDIEPNSDLISSLIEDRFKENKSFKPNIMRIAEDMDNGISDVNINFYTAITDSEKTIRVFKNSIENNYILDVLMLRSEFSDAGCNVNDIWDIDDKDIHEIGKETLLLYTDDKGKCSLTKTSDIVDTILSKKGQEDLIHEKETNRSIVEKINKTTMQNPKLKSNNLKKNKIN